MTELSTLPANASKIEIKNAIGEYNSELKRFKEQLTNMVPYRALAGFFARSKEKAEWNSIRRMTTYIKEINDNITPLPYVLGESSKLKKEVRFHQDWIKMIQDNTVNILGWIQYEKVKWLQNNNPEVPGLIYKLVPMNDKMRKLSNVRIRDGVRADTIRSMLLFLYYYKYPHKVYMENPDAICRYIRSDNSCLSIHHSSSGRLVKALLHRGLFANCNCLSLYCEWDTSLSLTWLVPVTKRDSC